MANKLEEVQMRNREENERNAKQAKEEFDKKLEQMKKSKKDDIPGFLRVICPIVNAFV